MKVWIAILMATQLAACGGLSRTTQVNVPDQATSETGTQTYEGEEVIPAASETTGYSLGTNNFSQYPGNDGNCRPHPQKKGWTQCRLLDDLWSTIDSAGRKHYWAFKGGSWVACGQQTLDQCYRRGASAMSSNSKPGFTYDPKSKRWIVQLANKPLNDGCRPYFYGKPADSPFALQCLGFKNQSAFQKEVDKQRFNSFLAAFKQNPNSLIDPCTKAGFRYYNNKCWNDARNCEWILALNQCVIQNTGIVQTQTGTFDQCTASGGNRVFLGKCFNDSQNCEWNISTRMCVQTIGSTATGTAQSTSQACMASGGDRWYAGECYKDELNCKWNVLARKCL